LNEFLMIIEDFFYQQIFSINTLIMKVKGTIISSVPTFVKDKFPDKYQEWQQNLPPASQQILMNTVMASEWYDIENGLLAPTRLLAKMFYESDLEKASWEMGRYSAEVGLSGIYKVFVLIATPQFIMKRGGKILSSFYQPSVLTTSNERPKGVDILITEFENSTVITESRIGGWMEKALEICGIKNITIDKVKSIAKGDNITQYVVNWE
jgi:hypothetical protein